VEVEKAKQTSWANAQRGGADSAAAEAAGALRAPTSGISQAGELAAAESIGKTVGTQAQEGKG